MEKNVDLRVLISFLIIALATVFQLAALASNQWVDTVTEDYGMVGSSGLWQTCSSWGTVDSCRGFRWTDNQVSHWFRTVQTFEVLGFVFGGVALLLLFLFHFVRTCMENRVLKVFSLALLGLSFVLVLSGSIIIGALKDVQKSMEIDSYARLSWGFGVSIVAAILYLVSIVAVVIS